MPQTPKKTDLSSTDAKAKKDGTKAAPGAGAGRRPPLNDAEMDFSKELDAMFGEDSPGGEVAQVETDEARAPLAAAAAEEPLELTELDVDQDELVKDGLEDIVTLTELDVAGPTDQVKPEAVEARAEKPQESSLGAADIIDVDLDALLEENSGGAPEVAQAAEQAQTASADSEQAQASATTEISPDDLRALLDGAEQAAPAAVADAPVSTAPSGPQNDSMDVELDLAEILGMEAGQASAPAQQPADTAGSEGQAPVSAASPAAADLSAADGQTDLTASADSPVPVPQAGEQSAAPAAASAPESQDMPPAAHDLAPAEAQTDVAPIIDAAVPAPQGKEQSAAPAVSAPESQAAATPAAADLPDASAAEAEIDLAAIVEGTDAGQVTKAADIEDIDLNAILEMTAASEDEAPEQPAVAPAGPAAGQETATGQSGEPTVAPGSAAQESSAPEAAQSAEAPAAPAVEAPPTSAITDQDLADLAQLDAVLSEADQAVPAAEAPQQMAPTAADLSSQPEQTADFAAEATESMEKTLAEQDTNDLRELFAAAERAEESSAHEHEEADDAVITNVNVQGMNLLSAVMTSTDEVAKPRAEVESMESLLFADPGGMTELAHEDEPALPEESAEKDSQRADLAIEENENGDHGGIAQLRERLAKLEAVVDHLAGAGLADAQSSEDSALPDHELEARITASLQKLLDKKSDFFKNLVNSLAEALSGRTGGVEQDKDLNVRLDFIERSVVTHKELKQELCEYVQKQVTESALNIIKEELAGMAAELDDE